MTFLRLLRAWSVQPLWDFWAKPIRAESLALFRILLAVTIIGSQLTGVMRTLPQTCAPGGYMPVKANDYWIANGSRLSLLRGPAIEFQLTSDSLESLRKEEVPGTVLAKLKGL